MAAIIYPILIFFGLAPSVIWLWFFLRKDNNPESKRMILKIFFFGMLATVPTALLELGFFEQVSSWRLPPLLFAVLYAFLGIGFVEEIFKYLVVKKMVLSHAEFDEPVDAMIYMITAAMGFAALENLLIFLPMSVNFEFLDTFLMSVFRFVGATFLHALCSGLIGYYIALSFCQKKNKTKLIIKGVAIATLLHGFYDLSIIKIEGGMRFLAPVLILFGLAIFVSWGFKKVKLLKGVYQ